MSQADFYYGLKWLSLSCFVSCILFFTLGFLILTFLSIVSKFSFYYSFSCNEILALKMSFRQINYLLSLAFLQIYYK